MRRRLGRDRTFGKSMVLAIGAVAIIVLIARRRAWDDQRTRRAKQATKEASDVIREAYKNARGRLGEVRERQAQYTTAFSERVTGNLRVGVESAQAASHELTDQAQKRVLEEVGKAPAQTSEEGQRGTGENIQADAGELPIEDYDSLNVHQVTQKLRELSVEELEQLRDYEAKNKNRRSIMQRFDTRIRAREGRSR
ncbi:MAG TPA: hypothetical protein VE288_12295 [Rubrobacteraceae bacterium]|nr:hypothetical protein [Rubrobacteraceae bacterium]